MGPAANNFFQKISTPRLILRNLEPGDAEAMFRYRSDPAVYRYQNWEPTSVVEIRDFINGLSKIDPDTPGKWFQIGIVEQDLHHLIGDCGIHVQTSDPRQVEIGISLDPRFQGRGLAAEALRGLLGYLFETLGKHRVFGSVDPRNTPSIALMERTGMRLEAHFVQSYWFKGTWADDMIFAMLRREWSRH